MSESKYKVGDRVQRLLNLINGEWHKHGDACLINSPVEYGRVIAVSLDVKYGPRYIYDVEWDTQGIDKGYLEHGLASCIE